MPFNIYRQDGYSGQDLHILRNGSPFLVSDFILVGASATVVYTFRLPGSASTFENIVVSSSGSGSSTIASITASAIAAPTLNNFYVDVLVTSGGEQSSTSILIRLHDAVTDLRLSPTPLTIRPSLSGVKFCVLATFTGGIMGEISWYPNLTWAFESNVPNYIVFDNATVPFTNQTTNRLNYIPPTTAPSAADFADCIKLTLPSNMQATGSISVAYGSISFKTDNPVITLLTGGNFSETDTRMNILMFSDGFGGGTSSNADFSTAVTEIKNEFGMQISKPWNLFERNINYWSFYLEGREGGGILTEPQIKITTGSTDIKTVSINQFCKTFRAVIIYLQDGTQRLFSAEALLKGVYDSDLVDFYDLSFFVASKPLSATSPENLPLPLITTGGILHLDELITVVGLPGNSDIHGGAGGAAKSFATKKSEWIAHGFNTYNGKVIKFEGDTILASEYVLTKYVFEVWKKLANIVQLDYPDTSLGVYRNGEGTFSLHMSKFYNLSTFNRFVHNIQYRAPGTAPTDPAYPLGEQFFDVHGGPTYRTGDGTITSQTTTVLKNKNADNIIVLSRVQKRSVSGNNEGIKRIQIIYNNSTAEIIFGQHFSVFSLHGNSNYVSDCIFSSIPLKSHSGSIVNTSVLKPKDTHIDTLDVSVKNVVIHELSHNYLDDEYTVKTSDLDWADPSIQVSKSQSFAPNLQTKWRLRDNPVSTDSPPAVGGLISGDRIIWSSWPRITACYVSTINLTSATGGQFLFYAGRRGGVIQVNDYVFLRTKNLISATYIKCQVKAISVFDPSAVIIEPVTGTITLADFPAKSLLILPVWIAPLPPASPIPVRFLSLVHSDIKARITRSQKALVEPDTLSTSGVSAIQLPRILTSTETGFATDPVTKWSDQSKIVGLFAGADGSFTNGAYHATGYCIMRQPVISTANSFCHVCRYILVDAVDPTFHPDIELDFALSYPL